MGKKTTETEKPKSEVENWFEMIGFYEKVLHPDFFNPIRNQASKVYEEMKARAYRDAKISPFALEIEKDLIRLKENIKQHCEHDGLVIEKYEHLVSWHIKITYKEFLKKIRQAYIIESNG